MPLYREITQKIRHAILTGVLAPGDRVPTVRELAVRFKTSAYTVQAALTPLAEEGLIARRRRSGTVVCHHAAALNCAGLYCASNMLDRREYAFYHEVCSQLQARLREDDVRTAYFMDTRPVPDQGTAFADLVEAVEQRRIQALFVVLSNSYSRGWLGGLPVAKSFVGSGPPMAHAVNYKRGQKIDLALRQLARRGCRTVGVISGAASFGDDGPGNDPTARFSALAAAHRLATRPEWVWTPRGEYVEAHEPYGYRVFNELWTMPTHPDGLLVTEDIVARGVMTAVLQRSIRVPEELKLVFHHNAGVDWACPLPVDWVESDVGKWAAAMLEQVRCQQRGEAVEQVCLDFVLRPAGKGGE